jgi:type I restriction-modification system DNA methylase subunit
LAFSKVIKNPLNIYGIDIDPLAVKIARINLLLKYKKIAFIPNIICRDSLLKKDNNLTILDFEETEKFAVVGTNPPWGVHFSKNDAQKLGKHYPEIKSGESFSYFLVKSHSDIRKFILDNFLIKKLNFSEDCSKMFLLQL